MNTKAIIISLMLLMLSGLTISSAQSKDIIIGEDGGEEEHRSERLAIVVGVNDYLDSKISDLSYAVSDAKRIANILEDKGVFDVQLLTNDKGEPPTKNNIISAFEDAEYLASRNLIKSFVLYFSGHGFENNNINYLAPMELDPSNLPGTAVNFDNVLDILHEMRENAKVMVFMDASRDNPKGRKSMGSGFARDDESHGLGIFYSTSPGQISLEVPELGGSVYSYYLVKALYGGADSRPVGNGDGYITFYETTAYVTYAMRQWTKDNPNMRQIPWVEITEKWGEFFITKAGEAAPPVDD